MLFDDRGFTPRHLSDGAGLQLEIPYRVPAHGFVLEARSEQLALVTIPVAASEDPAFGPYLCRRGIYRIEDPTGSVARIGEGRVIDRVRRHRASPPVLPARLVAAFPTDDGWSPDQRRFLEETWANRWAAEGNVLASARFTRRPLIHDPVVVAQLQSELDYIDDLAAIALRILDNDADEFAEVTFGDRESVRPGHASPKRIEEAKFLPARQGPLTTALPSGTSLFFADGRIEARATVRRSEVALHEGSGVYVVTAASTGARFRSLHDAFLAAAQVKANGNVGVTNVRVASSSAAHLIKHVTGGRFHAVSRWRIV